MDCSDGYAEVFLAEVGGNRAALRTALGTIIARRTLQVGMVMRTAWTEAHLGGRTIVSDD